MPEKPPRPLQIDEPEARRRLEAYRLERERLQKEHAETLKHIAGLEEEVLTAQPGLRSQEATETDPELKLLRRQFDAFTKKYPLGKPLGDMQELLLIEMAELTYRALEKVQENVWEHSFFKEILRHANEGYLRLISDRPSKELKDRVAKQLKDLGISV